MTAPRHVETIDDVLAVLREVVDESILAADRIGYFAARSTTGASRTGDG